MPRSGLPAPRHPSPPRAAPLLELNAESHFLSFVQRFGKSYKDADENAYRLSVFKANLSRTRQHKLLDPSAEHGITKFSNLTPAEFRRTYLSLRKSWRALIRELGGSAHEAPMLPTDGLPNDFDWRDHGAVGPIKNKGSCGSCWSFSASGALEGAHYLATGKLEVLSKQQMVDCDHECTRLLPLLLLRAEVAPFLEELGPRLLKIKEQSSGLFGWTYILGMAFGTGSAMAHRAVDAVMGPRTIQHETVVSEAAPVAPMSNADSCNIHS